MDEDLVEDDSWNEDDMLNAGDEVLKKTTNVKVPCYNVAVQCGNSDLDSCSVSTTCPFCGSKRLAQTSERKAWEIDGRDISDDYINGREVTKFPAIIPLNVGGKVFMTRLSTLRKYPDSMLASMFSGRHKVDQDNNDYYFLDTDGTYFSYLLDYLRHEKLPPREVALGVYREAGYFGLPSLQEALINTPEVGRMLVRERHRDQFPSYFAFRLQVIQLAMKTAVPNKMGEVIIFAHRGESKNIHNSCVTETAHLKIGPWDAPVDEEVFIRTLHSDFIEMGFQVNPFEKRRCKWYVQGQTCQRCVFKLTFIFT